VEPGGVSDAGEIGQPVDGDEVLGEFAHPTGTVDGDVVEFVVVPGLGQLDDRNPPADHGQHWGP
jgi:hypothetical protein